MNIPTKAITDALLWPVNDVPKIFSIAQTGIGPALPALLEVGAVASIYVIDIKAIDNPAVKALLAYGAAAGIAFAFRAM